MTSIPGTTLSPAQVEDVRYAENIKAYPLGRYIDPNDPDVMHEAHTIYRVETTTKWNLHPQYALVSSLPAIRNRDSASTPVLLRDELAVELNRQRTATNTVIQGNQKLNQKLDELSAAVKQTQRTAEETAKRQKETDSRLDNLRSLEDDLNKPKQPEGTPPSLPPLPPGVPSDW